jgi:hypothetical protein
MRQPSAVRCSRCVVDAASGGPFAAYADERRASSDLSIVLCDDDVRHEVDHRVADAQSTGGYADRFDTVQDRTPEWLEVVGDIVGDQLAEPVERTVVTDCPVAKLSPSNNLNLVVPLRCWS